MLLALFTRAIISYMQYYYNLKNKSDLGHVRDPISFTI